MKKLTLLILIFLSFNLFAETPDDSSATTLNQIERLEGEGVYNEDRQFQEEQLEEFRYDETVRDQNPSVDYDGSEEW
jgi:hypothetical protein